MIKNMKWKVILVVLVTGLAFWKAYPPQEKVNLGLDLQGGMHLVLRVDTSKLPPEAREDAAERALEIIRNRVDQFGVREPSIQRQGKEKIIVQLPGITERDRALDLIGKTALLEFKLVSNDPEKLRDALSGNIPEGYLLEHLENQPILLEKEASLTGEALLDASVAFDQARFNEPYVSFRLNPKGARHFAKITRDNIGRRLAIVLDGKIQSAPVIQSEIPAGQGQITGRFTIDEVNDLAIVLRAGALPAPLLVEEERTVGPTLGQDSISKGIRAVITGGVLVLLFMAFYYMLAGLIANFALILNLIFILGALAYFGASLTLPGIAGIVLTLGMAVDANVLIFERIREEMKLGRPVRLAITNGYKKAFLTILDSNLTTLIVALILFQFGTGPVRGFATTLSIGIIASFFTAVVVTRLMLELLSLRKGFARLRMLELVKEPKINFIDKRKTAYAVSLIVIIIGLVSFGLKGERNFGIDFAGGTIQEYRFTRAVSVDQIRGALKEIGLGDSSIQQIRGTNRVMIRTYAEISDRILEKFGQIFSPGEFEIMRIEKVGPAVGQDLRKKAVLAVFYSLAGICAYVSLRFEFRFAIAAIIALFHDVLIALGALSLTGRELSLPVIAALLTIVGYSINDTIVVFDRIREDLRLMRKADYKTVINASINQTLSRTLLTSLTTLLVVISLYFRGGAVINDFAFTLIVGVIVGTYSSIFVASPILVDWRRIIRGHVPN